MLLERWNMRDGSTVPPPKHILGFRMKPRLTIGFCSRLFRRALPPPRNKHRYLFSLATHHGHMLNRSEINSGSAVSPRKVGRLSMGSVGDCFYRCVVVTKSGHGDASRTTFFRLEILGAQGRFARFAKLLVKGYILGQLHGTISSHSR
jgi:hypothetical protein